MIAAFTILISSLFSLPPLFIALALTALSFTPQVKNSLNVVVSNPLIGKSRQSMGNATFSTWKGINVLKEKPQSVANPQSDGQIQQRSAFSQMVAAFREMPSAVRAGFKKLAVKKSEFNAFVSYNLKNAFDLSVPSVATIVAADVLVSKGTIAQSVLTSAVADRSSNTITTVFPDIADQPGQSVTDVPIIAAYNATQGLWTGGIATAERQDGTANIPLPAAWNTGDTVTIYLGFYNPLTGESSDSANTTWTVQA